MKEHLKTIHSVFNKKIKQKFSTHKSQTLLNKNSSHGLRTLFLNNMYMILTVSDRYNFVRQLRL